MSTSQHIVEEFVMNNPKSFNLMKNFDWKRYFKYHLKWQAGIVITAPLMYLFIDYCQMNYWAAVFSFQFVGAIIFWPIDNYIFNRKKVDPLDLLYTAPTLGDVYKDQLLKDHTDSLKEEAREAIKNPQWDEAMIFADWRSKVPTGVQKNWSKLTESEKLMVYYFTKVQAISEEE